MKKSIVTIFILITGILTFAQQNNCQDFAQLSVDQLFNEDYLPDGRYNSTLLKQGDKIEIYKSFFKNKEYMILISAKSSLPGVTYQIKTMARSIVISSDEVKNKHSYIYKPERNQNLIISVVVDKNDDFDNDIIDCVSIIIGYKN